MEKIMNVEIYDAVYPALTFADNADIPLENYPNIMIEALREAGFAIVPRNLPHEALGECAMLGIHETGNPKHTWDFLLNKVEMLP